jgi:hypothetical protein
LYEWNCLYGTCAFSWNEPYVNTSALFRWSVLFLSVFYFTWTVWHLLSGRDRHLSPRWPDLHSQIVSYVQRIEQISQQLPYGKKLNRLQSETY